jgi:SAM-dependent methyltransferase
VFQNKVATLQSVETDPYFEHKLQVFQNNCCKGKVLDYGCCTGGYTTKLATLGWEVWGVDSNKDYLNLAIELSHQQGLEEKCHFCEITKAEKHLPFERGFFDSVFASEIIEHLPDIATFIAEVKRVLRKDGTLYLTTPNGVSYRHIAKNLLWRAKRRIPVIESWPQYLPDKEGHIYYWDVWTLYRLMNINGFTYVMHDYAEQHSIFRMVSAIFPVIRPLRTGMLLVLKHTQPEKIYK